MHTPVEQSLIRIYRGDGGERKNVGAGWLISPRHCLTCAHVVNLALRREPDDQAKPEKQQTVSLSLPNHDHATADTEPSIASVAAWFPPGQDLAPADIAVLLLNKPITGIPPICVLPPDQAPPPGDTGTAYGFPRNSRDGIDANAKLAATHGGLRQVNAIGKPEIEPGYSGGPFTDGQQRIIGMTAQRNSHHQTARIIPVETLEKAWPELTRLRCSGVDPTLTLRLKSNGERLTIQTPDGQRDADLTSLQQAVAQGDFVALHNALFDDIEHRNGLLGPARQPDASTPCRLQLVCADANSATLPWHCIEATPGHPIGQAGWVIECITDPALGGQTQILVDTLILAPADNQLTPGVASHVSQMSAHLRRLLANPQAVPDRAHDLPGLRASLKHEPDLIYVYAPIDNNGALIIGNDTSSAHALTLESLCDELKHLTPKPLLWLHCITTPQSRLDTSMLHQLTQDYPLLLLQRTRKRRAFDSQARSYAWIDALADSHPPEPAAALSRAPNPDALCWQAKAGLQFAKPKDADAALMAYIRAALIRLRLGRETQKILVNGVLRKSKDASLLFYAIAGERDACPHDFAEQARYELEADDSSQRVELHWLQQRMEPPDPGLQEALLDTLDLHLGMTHRSTREALESLRLQPPPLNERVVIALNWLLEPADGFTPAQLGSWLQTWKRVMTQALLPSDIPARCRLLIAASIQWPSSDWLQRNNGDPQQIQTDIAAALRADNPHYCSWVRNLQPLLLLDLDDLISFFDDFAQRPDNGMQGLKSQQLADWCLQRCQGRFDDTVTLIYRACKNQFSEPRQAPKQGQAQ